MQNKIVATLKAHRKRELKRFYIIISFLMIAFISLVFDIATGPSLLAPKEVLSALLSPFTSKEIDSTTLSIVYDLRLPIALMALVVGAALGIGGAEIQTLLNNP